MKTTFNLGLAMLGALALQAGAAVGQPATTNAPATAATAPAQTQVQSMMQAAPQHADPYVPPVMRRPPRDGDQGASGPALQYQAMQKLKQRFEEADADGSGSLSREEARKAGLGFVDKNFDHIDSAKRGNVSFDDLKTYLMQRREEARSR